MTLPFPIYEPEYDTPNDADPGDEYLYAEPRTFEELYSDRQVLSAQIAEGPSPEPARITCDACRLVSRCVFAFDPYNTNGDCLLEK